MRFFIFNYQRLIPAGIANRRGKCVPTLEAGLLVPLLRVDAAPLFRQARYGSPSQTRRKRAASRGAAKAAITGRRLRAGNSDVPATATCRRHLLCGNPSTWPEQSYGIRSNIKVDNVHNPTRRDSKDANMRARAACDCHHWPSAVYSCHGYMVVQGVSGQTRFLLLTNVGPGNWTQAHPSERCCFHHRSSSNPRLRNVIRKKISLKILFLNIYMLQRQ